MATLVGKLLGGLGIGRNAVKPAFSSSPIGILAPAQMQGVTQQPFNIGILNPANDVLGAGSGVEKPSTLDTIFGTASSVLDIAMGAKEILSRTADVKVNQGTINETVVSGKPTFVENFKTAVGKMANGEPVVTMGHEFSIPPIFKIPLLIGLCLLVWKLFKGR